MKELFFSFLSSGWAKPIFFALAMAGAYKLSHLGRGKRRKRNFSFISEKLSDQGFGKWLFLDFFIYMALATVIGFALFGILSLISQFFMPSDAIYQNHFGFFISALSSMFFGITAPAFLWVKTAKLIHKKRYKKYMLYSMAHQNMDLLHMNKIIVQPLCILCLIIGLLGTHALEIIKDDQLIERGLFDISSTTHSLEQIQDFLITDKFVAPNGNTIEKTRLLLKFNDGYIWESISLGEDFTEEEMTTLARHIFTISKVQPQAVDFSPYD